MLRIPLFCKQPSRISLFSCTQSKLHLQKQKYSILQAQSATFSKYRALSFRQHARGKRMAPIKSSISRVLRSRIPISKQITASRGLTRTATNANAVEYSVHSSQPAPYFPPGTLLFLPSSNFTCSLIPDQRFRPSFPLTNTTPSSSIFPSALSSPTPLPPTVVQTVQTPSFSSLISSLSSSLTSTSKPDLKHLNSLLRSYTSVPGQWDRFAHKDPSMQYTRNLVMSVKGVFDLILLVWTPGKKSPVHDHAGADCLMKVSSFPLSNDLHKRERGKLTVRWYDRCYRVS